MIASEISYFGTYNLAKTKQCSMGVSVISDLTFSSTWQLRNHNCGKQLISLYNHPRQILQIFWTSLQYLWPAVFLGKWGNFEDFRSFAGGVFGVSSSGGGFLKVARGSQGGPTTSQLQSPANPPAESSSLEMWNKTGLKSVSSQCLPFFSLLAASSEDHILLQSPAPSFQLLISCTLSLHSHAHFLKSFLV